MGAAYGIGNLKEALREALVPSSYQGVVGAGSTATDVVDSVGGFTVNQWENFGIQFTGDTTTLALRGVWQKVVSNTADTLTLAAALPAVPAAGDTYDIRVFGSQTADMTAWGGAPLAPADANGVPKVQQGYTEGAPGQAAPVRALQIAGTDGAALRTLATDSQGRLTPQPTPGVWDAAGLAVAAATNFFAQSYSPPSYGVLTVTIGNLSTGTSAVFSLIKTANTAPTGGSAGTRPFELNSGNDIVAGQIGTYAIVVTPNDDYNLQASAATSCDVTAVFKPNGG